MTAWLKAVSYTHLAVVKKIDELARKNKVSREEYIRRYLTKVSELEDIQNIDEKYHNLVDAVVDRLEQEMCIRDRNIHRKRFL